MNDGEESSEGLIQVGLIWSPHIMLNNNEDFFSKSDGSYLRKPKGYLNIYIGWITTVLNCFRLRFFICKLGK